MTRLARIPSSPRSCGRIAAVALAAALAFPGAAQALTPQQQCDRGRLDAESRYVQCEQKQISKVYSTGSTLGIDPIMAKCRAKYAATWIKLQTQAAGNGSSCDTVARFVDSLDGTVTDRFTDLQWRRRPTI